MSNTERVAEPIALVDLDGTLADFDGAMQSGLTAMMSPNEDPELNQRDMDHVPYLKARRRAIKATPGFWSGLEPLKLGFDILEVYEEMKFKPMILTKGPANPAGAWTEKFQWCKKHVPHLPITISDDKGLVYGKTLADDWPSYIERWLHWRPRGLVVVPAQSWNVDIEVKFPNNTVRYDGSNMDRVREKLKIVRATAGE